jgi:hypothetical protein
MNARMTCVTMPRRDTERERVCVCVSLSGKEGQQE